MEIDLSAKPWTGKDCYHPKWDQLRADARSNDGGVCRKCGSPDRLVGHHLVYLRGRRDWEYPRNFILTLCHHCHDEYHNLPGRKFRDDMTKDTEEEGLKFINEVASLELGLARKDSPTRVKQDAKIDLNPPIEEMTVESELVELFSGKPPKTGRVHYLKAEVPEALWQKYHEMSKGLTQDLVVRESLKFALENDVFNQRIARFKV